MKEQKSAKEKTNSQKNELAAKIKELMQENEASKTQLETVLGEKEELERLVEFLKNAGQRNE